MSRLIKSTNAKETTYNVKTIKVKPITNSDALRDSLHEEGTEVTEKRNVHYIEQNRILSEAETEAKSIIEEARKQIDEWTFEIKKYEDQVNERSEELFRQAEELGRKEGYEAGFLEGKRAYEAEIIKAQKIVEKAKHDYFLHMENAEPVMVELAMEVAKKIVGTALESEQEAWSHVLKNVMEEVRGRGEITIYVHPDWYEATLHQQHELKQITIHASDIYIYPKSELPPNGCIIETPVGQVDASIDSQLKEVKRILLEKWNDGEQHENK